MGKLIAVWGSPDSGKTTFSVKLAEALYNRSRGKSAVIVVFTDIVTPTIPVIFPNFRSEDVFSELPFRGCILGGNYPYQTRLFR